MKLLEGLFNSLKEKQNWNLGEIKNKIDNFDDALSKKITS